MIKKHDAPRLGWVALGLVLIAYGAIWLTELREGGDALVVIITALAKACSSIFKAGSEHFNLMRWIAIIVLYSIFVLFAWLFHRKTVTLVTLIYVIGYATLFALFGFLHDKIGILIITNKTWMNLMLVVFANIILALGVALFIFANLGFGPYEAAIAMINYRAFNNKMYWLAKIIFDVMLIGAGIIINAINNVSVLDQLGYGSIISIALSGLFIEMWTKVIKPRANE